MNDMGEGRYIVESAMDKSEHYVKLVSRHKIPTSDPSNKCRCGCWYANEPAYVWQADGWDHSQEKCYPRTPEAQAKLDAYLPREANVQASTEAFYRDLTQNARDEEKTAKKLLHALYDRFLALEERFGADRCPTDWVILAEIERVLDLPEDE